MLAPLLLLLGRAVARIRKLELIRMPGLPAALRQGFPVDSAREEPILSARHHIVTVFSRAVHKSLRDTFPAQSFAWSVSARSDSTQLRSTVVLAARRCGHCGRRL